MEMYITDCAYGIHLLSISCLKTPFYISIPAFRAKSEIRTISSDYFSVDKLPNTPLKKQKLLKQKAVISHFMVHNCQFSDLLFRYAQFTFLE